ncbi:hypothetical protein [Kitasatospora sp. NPDC056184]|uniref:hypothetical protein n=1 Tax=Kitasatospora sp. NPDC056184 TaxID=3345738 RepID=UPI0035DF9854
MGEDKAQWDRLRSATTELTGMGLEVMYDALSMGVSRLYGWRVGMWECRTIRVRVTTGLDFELSAREVEEPIRLESLDELHDAVAAWAHSIRREGK